MNQTIPSSVNLKTLRKEVFEEPSTSVASYNNNKRLKTDELQCDLLDLSVDNCRPTDVSIYFPNLQRIEVPMLTIENKLLQLQLKLNKDLSTLNMIKPPIEYVYNPLDYAFNSNEVFVKKYCTTTKKILFIGMNPGPFGMCQTGVPFGDPWWVREWLKVEAEVLKPPVECPGRKILGFNSQRKEQSGDRFWGLFCKLCGSPENFFRYSFVSNFCPLAFMKHNGCNVTPSELKSQDRRALESICDSWYLDLIDLLKPEIIIAIGEYMERKTRDLVRNNSRDVNIIRMPHPSPRAINNQNWPEKTENFLRERNLLQYFQNNDN